MPRLALPEQTADGRARGLALNALQHETVAPTSIVEFVSRGRCLVIGDEPIALAFATRIPESLSVVVAVPGDGRPQPHRIDGINVVRGGRPMISGALGDFDVSLAVGDERLDLGSLLDRPGERVDLIIDLNAEPKLRQGMPPLGYYAPGPDQAAWDDVLATIPEMCGEFEKPKYYNYDPEICAHGASGKRGCNRCIDACPAEAIISIGETVEVNPYLCQGGGACATACPTGAMTYAYPQTGDLLTGIRNALQSYSEAGGCQACLLFHDASGVDAIAGRLGPSMPERVLPIEVEDIGSVGMDTWLAALAYGAEAIIILTTDNTPAQVVETAQDQLITARAILAGMNYPEDCLQLANADERVATLETLQDLPGSPLVNPARFAAPPRDKRGTLRLALDHLCSQAPAVARSAELPAGAAFGQVLVDGNACTLCMSCVSVCPTHALQDGRGLPQLHFREWNCVQCGLCERACPESAVGLEARFLYDREERERSRLLHEEPPFCCVGCGKPFATRSMLQQLERKLEGHWMFQSDQARRRLQMCEDCKVKDMFANASPSDDRF